MKCKYALVSITSLLRSKDRSWELLVREDNVSYGDTLRRVKPRADRYACYIPIVLLGYMQRH